MLTSNAERSGLKVSKSRFQSHYDNVLRYDLAEKLCVSNSYQTPKIEKIILSASVSFKPQQVRGLSASSKSNSNIGRLAPTSKRTKGKSMKGRSGGGIMPSMGSAMQGLENCTLEVRNAMTSIS